MNYDINIFAPQYEELNVQIENIIMRMGYEYSECPEEIISVTNQLFRESRFHVQLKAGFRIIEPREFAASKKEMVIGDLTFLIDRMISAHLKKVDTIAIFVCSLGKEYDKWIRSFYDGNDGLNAYIADIIGSETVEAAADWIEEYIRKASEAEGCHITNRLSPGYCNWHVSEQKKLFSLLPESFCGVALTESALMTPIKSVSGIIGIGAETKKLDYQCHICSIDHCYMKRKSTVKK